MVFLNTFLHLCEHVVERCYEIFSLYLVLDRLSYTV
jgi:hypothetical protein